ncbi:uncharacterized protein LOC130657453 [Hydractinia symbiolongicarpus]|uniref:uncharacterized protein LOC130657453 n=1 Tax=Hydractinia symbiolongicarpus TaxID=13093 RepID=UPI00254FEF4A|nr:uncharacterized protein LOC130657453 [Hydractinia symbiolongicarpus]XP_057316422.1 uncharacterized protein LOC130657453 [Hydractinia symbiolongicarpus]
MGKRSILSVVRLITIVCFVHFYIFLCAFAYNHFEGFDADAQAFEQVKTFLLDAYVERKTNKTLYLLQYKKAVREEVYWKGRHEFNSIYNCYLFVLAAHTTLGNRRMTIQTWKGQLLYVFSAPIGVIFYYIMIHTIAMSSMKILKAAVTAIYRMEDRQLTDGQREIFTKVKVAIASFLMAIVFVLIFGLMSLLDGNTYLNDIYYITNMLLTINSSIYFIFNDSHVNVVLATSISFVCLLFAHLTILSLVQLFQTHRWRKLADLTSVENPDSKHNSHEDLTFLERWDEHEESKSLFYCPPSFTSSYITGHTLNMCNINGMAVQKKSSKYTK